MNKHLPDQYVIKGLEAAQGVIFRDPLSAIKWLSERGLVAKPDSGISIRAAEVIYYPDNISYTARTTEDLMLDRKNGQR